jgi:hypothetical protein
LSLENRSTTLTDCAVRDVLRIHRPQRERGYDGGSEALHRSRWREPAKMLCRPTLDSIDDSDPLVVGVGVQDTSGTRARMCCSEGKCTVTNPFM